MRELPSGAVTFLFTDIEGSTRLLQEIGGERYAEQLLEHRRRIRDAASRHGGFEVGTEGDAFFLAFARVQDALTAASEMQEALAAGPVRVRMGVHSGEPLVVDDDYVGLDVHKAARICSAAHGGQVLVSQAARHLAGRELRDLGEHRLKDLAAPERLYQLGDADFPPPRTLRRTNLPVQPTPLLGRQRELSELVPLVREHRLITLTGPGGSGKTRLALEAAAEVAEHFPDGVWWVPLAAVVDPALLEPSVALALGSPEDLASYLSDRRLLLVLDNLEQVLGAAPAIGDLLAAAPGVKALCTSRERLGLAAEHEYAVPPLSEAAATELFVTRARQVKRDFEVDDAVPEICRRLDRLPLALELSATRVKIMTPVQMLDRLERRLGLLGGGLRGLPERQSTMRATIDWSYELLSEAERRAFRSLGVFAGSFELDAAQAVAGADLDELQSLVDKSLLRQTGKGRFFLLETTREYALDRLREAGEERDLRRRHAGWFSDLAPAAEEGVRSPDQGLWFARLRDDQDNLRAALAWALEEDIERGLRLAAALWRPWHMRGQHAELIGWYERALAGGRAIDPPLRASSLEMYGSALSYAEEYGRAEAVLQESIALFRKLGDTCGEATVMDRLGSVESGRGRVEEAVRHHEHALATFRRLGDRRGAARSLHLLGECLRDLGYLDRAQALLEESVAIDVEHGDRHAAMTSLHSLGDLALDVRDPERAADRYREALAIAAAQADDRSQAYCVAGLACVAALRGAPDEAGRLWGTAEELESRLDHRMLAHERSRYERILSGHEHDGAFHEARAAARTEPTMAVVEDLLR